MSIFLHDYDVTEFDDFTVMMWGIIEVYDCDMLELWMIELGFDCIVWIRGIWEVPIRVMKHVQIVQKPKTWMCYFLEWH